MQERMIKSEETKKKMSFLVTLEGRFKSSLLVFELWTMLGSVGSDFVVWDIAKIERRGYLFWFSTPGPKGHHPLGVTRGFNQENSN